MKKAVISTFNDSLNNYGAVFQSFALGCFLKELGCEPYNVTIINRGKSKIVGIKQVDVIKNKIKELIKNLVFLPKIFQLKTRKQKFKSFISETQNQIVFKTEKDLNDDAPQADIYISGSDQVWNAYTFYEDFFLGYAPDNSVKISYAASMGKEGVPEYNEQRFKKFIARFDAISVREDTMVDILTPYTDKEIIQNVDPVFLVSKDRWMSLEKPYKNLRYKDYILVYAIAWTAKLNDELKRLKNASGLKVVSINIGNMKNVCADQIVFDASPNEFLYLLHHSKMVVTTSFHGTALSIIYNKQFSTFVGVKNPSRIASLLRHFDLTNRQNMELINEDIDYDTVNKQIKTDRKQARNYLSEFINK